MSAVRASAAGDGAGVLAAGGGLLRGGDGVVDAGRRGAELTGAGQQRKARLDRRQRPPGQRHHRDQRAHRQRAVHHRQRAQPHRQQPRHHHHRLPQRRHQRLQPAHAVAVMGGGARQGAEAVAPAGNGAAQAQILGMGDRLEQEILPGHGAAGRRGVGALQGRRQRQRQRGIHPDRRQRHQRQRAGNQRQRDQENGGEGKLHHRDGCLAGERVAQPLVLAEALDPGADAHPVADPHRQRQKMGKQPIGHHQPQPAAEPRQKPAAQGAQQRLAQQGDAYTDQQRPEGGERLRRDHPVVDGHDEQRGCHRHQVDEEGEHPDLCQQTPEPAHQRADKARTLGPHARARRARGARKQADVAPQSPRGAKLG